MARIYFDKAWAYLGSMAPDHTMTVGECRVLIEMLANCPSGYVPDRHRSDEGYSNPDGEKARS